MAQSISLAVLENLVHTSKVDFPVGYVTVSALIPAELTILREKDINIDSRTLARENWATNGWRRLRQPFCECIPQEFNFLLNPRHPGFAQIIAEPPIPCGFDERLFLYP
jgi:hypothetical protein